MFNVVCLLGVVTVLSLALGGLVFGPIRDLGEPRRQSGIAGPVREMRQSFEQPFRFRIMDLLILFLQLQVAMGLLSLLGVTHQNGWELTLYIMLQTSIWWLEGLRMLTLANVQRTFDRAWFLGLLVPVGFLGATLLVIVPVGVLTAALLLFGAPGDPNTYVKMMVVLGLTASLLGILYGLRLVCGTLVARTEELSTDPGTPAI